MLTDSHCHLQFDSLFEQRNEIVDSLYKIGVSKLVVNGTHPNDWEKVLQLAQDYPDLIIPALGLHPWKVKERTIDWYDILSSFVRENTAICIGEIGLDKWISNHEVEIQKECFKFQLNLATELNRPVSIHCLKAWGSLFEILESHSLPERGIHIHAFGGSKETFEALRKFRPYFSFSGYFLHQRKSSIAALFKQVPEDRILVETDAPEMLPPAKFQKIKASLINHPINIDSITQGLADIRNTDKALLVSQIKKNFTRYFSQP